MLRQQQQQKKEEERMEKLTDERETRRKNMETFTPRLHATADTQIEQKIPLTYA